jgi:hypothetical protein
VAEWQTRRSQKPLRGNSRAGSSPAFGTIKKITAHFKTEKGEKMVFEKLFKDFLKSLSETPPTPASSPTETYSLPHPEEPMNPSATMANTDSITILTKWLSDWEVPAQNWDYWKTVIDIQVYDIYPASVIAMGISQDIPAATWFADGKRHLAIKTQWLNPGVIAHEQAHNSYWLLKEEQKKQFAAAYKTLKENDTIMKFLFSKQVTTRDDVEAHAEIYRYLGQNMAAQLKTYYPLLF